MKALDFYQPAYYSDGIYIWSSNGVMALMICDEISKDPEALLSRTCDIINDIAKPSSKVSLSYDAPTILLNGKPFLVIRGWGQLISDGFSIEEASCIQDEFAGWVIDKLTMK